MASEIMAFAAPPILASFSISNGSPPIDYDRDSFDFVYVISVFTHLDEDYQFRWLEGCDASPNRVA